MRVTRILQRELEAISIRDLQDAPRFEGEDGPCPPESLA
jgi:hypothetical protein